MFKLCLKRRKHVEIESKENVKPIKSYRRDNERENYNKSKRKIGNIIRE